MVPAEKKKKLSKYGTVETTSISSRTDTSRSTRPTPHPVERVRDNQKDPEGEIDVSVSVEDYISWQLGFVYCMLPSCTEACINIFLQAGEAETLPPFSPSHPMFATVTFSLSFACETLISGSNGTYTRRGVTTG